MLTETERQTLNDRFPHIVKRIDHLAIDPEQLVKYLESLVETASPEKGRQGFPDDIAIMLFTLLAKVKGYKLVRTASPTEVHDDHHDIWRLHVKR